MNAVLPTKMTQNKTKRHRTKAKIAQHFSLQKRLKTSNRIKRDSILGHEEGRVTLRNLSS